MAETYKLQKGDTLSAVAKRLNMTLAQLLAINPQINTSVKNWDRKLKIGQEIITKPGPPPPESGGPIKGPGGRGYNMNYDKNPSDKDFKPKVVNPTSQYGRPASAQIKEDKWREGHEKPQKKKEVAIPVQVDVPPPPPPPPRRSDFDRHWGITPEMPWQEKVATAISAASEDPHAAFSTAVGKLANKTFGMDEASAARLASDVAIMFGGTSAGGAGFGGGIARPRMRTDPRHAPVDPVMQGWRPGMTRPPAGELSVIGERPLSGTSMTAADVTPRAMQRGPLGQANFDAEPGGAPMSPANFDAAPGGVPPAPSLTGGAPLTAPPPMSPAVTPVSPAAKPVLASEPPLGGRSLRPGVRGKLENTLVGSKTKREKLKRMGEESIDPMWREAIEKGRVGTVQTPEPVVIPANRLNTVKDLGKLMRGADKRPVVIEGASDLGFASDRVMLVAGRKGTNKVDPEKVLDSLDMPILTQANFANVLRHIGFK